MAISAADLHDLLASEIAKNKSLVHEVDRVQTMLFASKQEAIEWKMQAEKLSYDADLTKREAANYQKEIVRLRIAIEEQRVERDDLLGQLQSTNLKLSSEVELRQKEIEDLQSQVETLTKLSKDLEAKLQLAERPPTQLIEAVNSVRAAAEEEIASRLLAQKDYYERRLELAANESLQFRKEYEQLRSRSQSAKLQHESRSPLAANSPPLTASFATTVEANPMDIAGRPETASGRLSVSASETNGSTSLLPMSTQAKQAAVSAVESGGVANGSSGSVSSVSSDREEPAGADENENENENETVGYLLSARPGSQSTSSSAASGDFRKQLQRHSAHARSHKSLSSVMPLVARPYSAPNKQASSIAKERDGLLAKRPSYIGDGPDYFDSMFGGRKQVKFGESEQVAAKPQEPLNVAADGTCLGVVLCTSGPIVISSVHPGGFYVRIYNTAQTWEEIGGHRLIQIVDGKTAVEYKFLQHARIRPGGAITVWAGSHSELEKIDRQSLSDSESNVIWKELQAWGAGPRCTTVFTKPTGEALCWVHGALLESPADAEINAQSQLSDQRTQTSTVEASCVLEDFGNENELDVDKEKAKAKEEIGTASFIIREKLLNGRGHMRRSSSTSSLKRCSDQSDHSPSHSPSTFRVDSFDGMMTDRKPAGAKGMSRCKSAYPKSQHRPISVGETGNLIRPSPFASPRTLVAQGLQLLQAQHNMSFQPPMFNPRSPVAYPVTSN